MAPGLPSDMVRLADLSIDIHQVMGRLVVILWPLTLLHILSGWTIIGTAGAFLLLVYLLLALLTLNLGNRILCLFLVTATVVVVLIDRDWAGLAESIEGALVFMAFVPTAHFLRNVAKREPRVLAFRERFMQAPATERPGWLLIGSNVLGSVLTAGSLAVLSPVFTARADATTRRSGALAAIAGTALACVWSPFFVAMAVTSSFLPDVPLWQAILVGMILCAMGLSLALALIGTESPLKTAFAALHALSRFLPLVLIAGICVVVLRGTTTLSTLEAACLALPPLCLLLILMRRRPAAETLFGLRRIALSTRREFASIGGEVSVVSFAFILAMVMRDSPSVSATVTSLGITALPNFAILTAVACGTAAGAMLSIHPIVGASVMLAIFSTSETQVSDLALMGAALLGWSSAAMLAYSGLLVIIATSMFDVRRHHLIFGRNMVLALAFAAIGTLMLSILDLFLT